MKALFALRRDFDAMLDRLETAVTGGGPDYTMIENLADVELTNRFVETLWDSLDHREQNAYTARLAYLRARGKSST